MSAAAENAVQNTQLSRSGRVLDLVRQLIVYGRELAATIRQRIATNPSFAVSCFGTLDLAVILARISRGLHRADALEARVLRHATHLDAGRRPGGTRSAAKAPAATPTASIAAETDPRLARLPTPAQIAAEVRRRPIGAVIGDICRDLGITPSHPLWRDVQRAMIEHGGSLAGLMIDLIHRAFSPTAQVSSAVTPAALRRPTLRWEAPGGAGSP